MKKVLFSSLAVTVLVLAAQVVLAGPTGGGGGGFGPPAFTPIDGGLSLIIGGGIAYAAKKGYNNRKNNKA